jgi:hypothetical protein
VVVTVGNVQRKFTLRPVHVPVAITLVTGAGVGVGVGVGVGAVGLLPHPYIATNRKTIIPRIFIAHLFLRQANPDERLTPAIQLSGKQAPPEHRPLKDLRGSPLGVRRHLDAMSIPTCAIGMMLGA